MLFDKQKTKNNQNQLSNDELEEIALALQSLAYHSFVKNNTKKCELSWDIDSESNSQKKLHIIANVDFHFEYIDKEN